MCSTAKVALTTFVQGSGTMFKYAVKYGIDFLFASRGLNGQVEVEAREQRLQEARKVLYGQRPHSEVRIFTSPDGRVLLRRSWSPPPGTKVIGLVYICHGFTEHMNLYNGIGEYLSNEGYYCFGTDLIGHGKSSLIDNQRAYIEDFSQCRQDILDHIQAEKDTIEEFYQVALPVFSVAHSMGGMIMIRLALDHPDLFSGMVLVGPLIYFGSSSVLRHLPMSKVMPPLNSTVGFVLDLVAPVSKYMSQRCQDMLKYTEVGSTTVENITNDTIMQELLKEDNLRHFGGAYIGMLPKFCSEVTRNSLDIAENKMKTPFCILFGLEDALCNVRGAWEMFFAGDKDLDKNVIEYEHAGHQLYLEIPQIRQKAMKDTLDFLKTKTNNVKGIFFHPKHYALNLGQASD